MPISMDPSRLMWYISDRDMSLSLQEDLLPGMSKKQLEIATCTTHVEYIGQCNAILHLQLAAHCSAQNQSLSVIGDPLMADIQSAIALSRNPEFHKQTKHFNFQFHYQRSVLDDEEISIQYIPTEL
jgi:hypothetical protein